MGVRGFNFRKQLSNREKFGPQKFLTIGYSNRMDNLPHFYFFEVQSILNAFLFVKCVCPLTQTLLFNLKPQKRFPVIWSSNFAAIASCLWCGWCHMRQGSGCMYRIARNFHKSQEKLHSQILISQFEYMSPSFLWINEDSWI